MFPLVGTGEAKWYLGNFGYVPSYHVRHLAPYSTYSYVQTFQHKLSSSTWKEMFENENSIVNPGLRLGCARESLVMESLTVKNGATLQIDAKHRCIFYTLQILGIVSIRTLYSYVRHCLLIHFDSVPKVRLYINAVPIAAPLGSRFASNEVLTRLIASPKWRHECVRYEKIKMSSSST